LLGFTAGSGAMIGDLIGAFIKRRLGLPRGAPAPILDQLDFIIIAILFASFLIKITPSMIFIVILITPFIHILVNGIAYKLGKKKEPW
jgi:CDP-2,3-bis-(O-geranylgeranyl)-sn-glycerol synthase